MSDDEKELIMQAALTIADAIFDGSCVIADAIESSTLKTEAATRAIAVKLDTANQLQRR